MSDNGVGFSKNIDFRETDSLGLQLVNNLTSQINGKVELNVKMELNSLSNLGNIQGIRVIILLKMEKN